MKIKTMFAFIPLVAVLVVGSGCGQRERSEDQEELYEKRVTIEQHRYQALTDAMAETWAEVADFSAEQRDDFVSAMEAAYASMQEQSAEMVDVSADLVEEANEAFRAQLLLAADATAEGWEQARDAVGDAWKALKKQYKEITD